MSRDSWLGIELRHFAALAAVAHERSFRRGADRLGYVQSAISRQIAFLEHLTGERLIERSQGPKPIELTEAGELLLSHANDILASIEAAKADIGDLQGGRSGDVRVGFFPGVPTRILASALVTFAKRQPSARAPLARWRPTGRCWTWCARAALTWPSPTCRWSPGRLRVASCCTSRGARRAGWV